MISLIKPAVDFDSLIAFTTRRAHASFTSKTNVNCVLRSMNIDNHILYDTGV